MPLLLPLPSPARCSRPLRARAASDARVARRACAAPALQRLPVGTELVPQEPGFATVRAGTEEDKRKDRPVKPSHVLEVRFRGIQVLLIRNYEHTEGACTITQKERLCLVGGPVGATHTGSAQLTACAHCYAYWLADTRLVRRAPAGAAGEPPDVALPDEAAADFASALGVEVPAGAAAGAAVAARLDALALAPAPDELLDPEEDADAAAAVPPEEEEAPRTADEAPPLPPPALLQALTVSNSLYVHGKIRGKVWRRSARAARLLGARGLRTKLREADGMRVPICTRRTQTRTRPPCSGA